MGRGSHDLNLRRLIEQRGRDGTIIAWLDALTAEARASAPRALATNVMRGAPICRRWCELPKPCKGDTANP